jgi:hypothetical protein
LWCGRGHLHKDCLEKEIENSSPSCCNCKLKDGERPHPSTYRGCSHAKEEMLRRKPQKPQKEPTGRIFSSRYIVPGQSFAAALRGIPQLQQIQQSQSKPVDRSDTQPTTQPNAQKSGLCWASPCPILRTFGLT